MIHALSLRDWMGLSEVTLSLANPLNIFLGGNGSGKTAIRDGVVWIAFGRCRGISTKKELPGVVIRDGAKATSGSLQFNGWRIERSLTLAGAETLRIIEAKGAEEVPAAGTLSELQTEIFIRLGIDEMRARAAMESWSFLALEDEDRVALLARTLCRPNSAAIERHLTARGITGVDAAELARSAAEKGFRAAESAAVERRKQAHRQLQALPAAVVANRIFVLDGDEKDLEKTTLVALEEGLKKAEAALLATKQTDIEDVGAARGRIAALREQETKLAAQTAAGVPDVRMLDLQRNLRKEAVEAGDRALAALDPLLAKARAIVDVATEIEHPGKCPVVPGEFNCPATKSGLQIHGRGLRKKADDAKADVERMEAERAEIVARREAAKVEHDGLDAQIREATSTAKAVKEANQELQRVRERIQFAEAGLKNAEANADEGRAKFLQERIDRIRPVVEAKRRYDAAKNDETPKKREQLGREHERADALAKAFAKEGVEADLLRESLAPIRERLAVTGPMLGKIDIRDDLSIVAEVDGRTRSLVQLSQSQRLRLAIALQDAIAVASGLPFLLVDELDLFDQATQSSVLRTLRGLVGDPYGSVLAFGTLRKGKPTQINAEGIRVWHVANHTVEVA